MITKFSSLPMPPIKQLPTPQKKMKLVTYN